MLLIDVVMLCSPGPGLSRARRGTDVHGERDRSSRSARGSPRPFSPAASGVWEAAGVRNPARPRSPAPCLVAGARSEEHTSELQSRQYSVCRLLLEKKKHHL